MNKTLSVLWGDEEKIPLTISHTVSLRYSGDLHLDRVMMTRRVSCVNEQLVAMIQHSRMYDPIFCNMHLVGNKCSGRRISPRKLRAIGLEALLVFLWKFPDLCREVTVIFPALVEGNPITLVPNGRGFLLCAPPAGMLRERNHRVLTSRG